MNGITDNTGNNNDNDDVEDDDDSDSNGCGCSCGSGSSSSSGSNNNGNNCNNGHLFSVFLLVRDLRVLSSNFYLHMAHTTELTSHPPRPQILYQQHMLA